jgi:chromosome partitioning protein
MATVVGFISQKGGVGKSTLARALAREAAAGGLTVKLADLDVQQATSVNWHRRRLDNGIEPRISVEAYKTAAQAIGAGQSFDMLVVDGPGRSSSGSLDIARSANLVVQPTGASLDDLEPAVLVFHELVRHGVPHDRLAFALGWISTEMEEQETRAYLGRAGYAVLNGSIPERPALRQAQNNGFAITETKYRSLAHRADMVLQDIVDRVNGHG